MKKYLFFILILGYNRVGAQSSAYGTKWYQIRKSSYNNSVDEWSRMPDTMPVKRDTVRFAVHDTIWQCPPILTLPFRFDSIAIITVDTSSYFIQNSWISSKRFPIGKLRKKKTKTKKTPRKVEYWVTEGVPTPCTTDTIRGIILYNNGRQNRRGNISEEGYWIGCYPSEKYIDFEGMVIIPGKFMRSELYSDRGLVKERVISSNEGRFFTKDFDPISSTVVYFMKVEIK